MAKNKKRRGGKSIIRTLEKFINIGTFVAVPASRASQTYQQTKDVAETAFTFFGSYAGLRRDRKFDPKLLFEVYMPWIAFNVVSKGVHKLNAILRKI